MENRRREATRCPDHNGPRSECESLEAKAYPQRRVCVFEMELAAARARYEELHQAEPFHDGTFERWAKERSDEYPYRYTDGVTLYVSPVDEDPEGTWLLDADEAADVQLERDYVAQQQAADAAADGSPAGPTDEDLIAPGPAGPAGWNERD